MRGNKINLAFATLEIVRFLALVVYVPGLSGSPDGMVQVVAVANLLYALCFFFAWMDPARYGNFRYLLVAGKAAGTVFALKALSTALATGSDTGLALVATCYDAASIAFAWFGGAAASPRKESEPVAARSAPPAVAPPAPAPRAFVPPSPEPEAGGSGAPAPEIETIDPT